MQNIKFYKSVFLTPSSARFVAETMLSEPEGKFGLNYWRGAFFY